MENKSFRRKIYALIVLGIMIIGCVCLSISYAWFLASVKGNEDANAVVIETGEMKVTFTYGNIIGTTENMIPGQYFELPFTVENTGTVATTYDIYLNGVTNTFVDKNDLVYTLTSTDGGRNIGETVLPSVSGVIASNIPISKPGIHHYVLRVLFKEDGTDQNDNMGASFSARVDLEEMIEPIDTIYYQSGIASTYVDEQYRRVAVNSTVLDPEQLIDGFTTDFNNLIRGAYNKYTLNSNNVVVNSAACIHDPYYSNEDVCISYYDFENSVRTIKDYFGWDDTTSTSEVGARCFYGDTYGYGHDEYFGCYLSNNIVHEELYVSIAPNYYDTTVSASTSGVNGSGEPCYIWSNYSVCYTYG